MITLWHKANITTTISSSLTNWRRSLIMFPISTLLLFSFQTMTAGDVVCTRIYEREWENAFKASSDINSNSLYLSNKHTLPSCSPCFPVSPVSLLCWSELDNTMHCAEQASTIVCWSSCHWFAVSIMYESPTLYIRILHFFLENKKVLCLNLSFEPLINS